MLSEVHLLQGDNLRLVARERRASAIAALNLMLNIELGIAVEIRSAEETKEKDDHAR